MARLVRRARPEARGIGGQDFVDEDDLVRLRACGASARWAGRRQPKLELGVGDDDPLRLGVFAATAIDLQGQIPEPGDQLDADEAARLLEADVLVVAAVGLGRRGEDRLGQPVGFLEAAPAAGCRRRRRSADTPSSRSRTGNLAPRIRPGSDRSCAPASSGHGGRRRAPGPPPETRPRPWRSGDGARDHPCARTRSRRAG